MEKCCTDNSCSETKHKVPRLSTDLTFSDHLGTLKVRCGIGRDNYKVSPGLYVIGKPDANSHVLVTGNYKMTVDYLRKELKKRNIWVLVLDTKGINVWCAAGKGTFSTKELINRIYKVNLSTHVNHKNLILPQLGATGVASHQVKKETGFNVIYGPVRAEDIPQFLDNDLMPDKNMRIVRFNTLDRAVLAPVEVSGAIKPTLFVLGILFIANAFGITKITSKDVKAYVGSVLVGTILVPIFLPAIPGRAFSFKGWSLGLLWALLVSKKSGYLKGSDKSLLKASQYFLILPSISAIHALRFTGSSTFTSMTGVQKEMKIAMPIIGLTIFAGIIITLLIPFAGSRKM